GTLVNFLGMKRVNTIGRSQANKCVTMAAIAYNLKKLLKHSSERANDRLKHAIPCPITRYTLFFKLLVRSNQTTI
ncbi:hypothetical protein, partial [Daejeonella lutea]